MQPEGPLNAAFLLERALDAQRRSGNELATAVVEGFMAAEFTLDPGPVDVCFWDGTADERENFGKVAAEWFEGTSLSLRWKTGGSTMNCPAAAFKNFEMRVSLGDAASLEAGDLSNTSWARIGKSGSESSGKVTIFIHPAHLLNPSRRNYYIRHEVGHALALLHEFQRAECKNRFNVDNIKKFYKERCHGTEMQRNACAEQAYNVNIATKVDSSPWGKVKLLGKHNSESCMSYLVPDDWVNNPDDFTCRLRQPCPALSKGDVDAIRMIYAVVVSADSGVAPVVAGPPATTPEGASLLPVPTSLEEFDTLALAAKRELNELQAIAAASRSGETTVQSVEDVPTASGIGQRTKSEFMAAFDGNGLSGPSDVASRLARELAQEIDAAEWRVRAYTLAPEARALLEAGARANTE